MVVTGTMQNKGVSKMNKVIGLTGGIASGKSTVSKILSDLGAVIIDGDIIARKIVTKGSPALDEIKNFFGEDYLNKRGELDRKKLGGLVFKDNEALKKLNEITHPKIIEEIKKEIISHKKNWPNTVIIVDAALLIEMKLTELVDEVWLVALPYEQQLKRLMERDQLTLAEAEKRVNSQMSLEEKKKFAHQTIDNSMDLEHLIKEVKVLWRNLD